MTAAFQRQSVVAHESSDASGDGPGTDKLGRECASAHATLLQRGYVRFHPVLADFAGGFKSALMLGHALYWTRHWLQRHPEREGWFWKTATEWRDATALTPREQESARQRLRDTDIWQERLAGAPARLHFRVDLLRLAELLAARSSGRTLPPSRWDRLTALLGLPIIYFRPLADLAGSPAAGLVLSHLISLQRSALQRGAVHGEGYFTINVEEARIALALSTKVQRNAREALKRAGFVQEAWTHERPPRLMAKVNLSAVLACLAGQGHRPIGRARRPAQPPAGVAEPASTNDRARVVGREGNVTRVIRLLVSPSGQPRGGDSSGQARVADSSKLDGKRAAKSRPFVETRVALLSNLYAKRDSSNTPTAPARDGQRLVDNPHLRSSRSPESGEPQDQTQQGRADIAELTAVVEQLICPTTLDKALHEGARRIVRRAPRHLWQLLLDELAGHMSSKHKVIENPLGWLHSVTTKAMKGDLVLTVAASVATTRQCRARYEAALADTGATPVSAHADHDRTPPQAVSPEEAELARARLKELRNELGAKSAANALLDLKSDATCRDLALSRTQTTHNGCALSQDGTTDPPIKGTRHVTHES